MSSHLEYRSPLSEIIVKATQEKERRKVSLRDFLDTTGSTLKEHKLAIGVTTFLTLAGASALIVYRHNRQERLSIEIEESRNDPDHVVATIVKTAGDKITRIWPPENSRRKKRHPERARGEILKSNLAKLLGHELSTPPEEITPEE